MSNENTNMSVEDIRKIVESSVCEYRKTMWVGDWEEDSKAFFQKEYDSRFQIWKRAAELGIPEGQWFVGGCHEHGIGGQRNIEEAIKWNRLAADSDFSLSQVELGSYFSNEEYVNPPNPAEAFKWFEKSAKNKDPEGELYAAYCYSNGDGVAENNEEAVKWFRAAADQGLAEAQYNLGCFYANGQGVAEDEKEAVRWYQKAAAQDYPAAQDELATCLLWGVGIAKNKAEALTLYRTAAEQGLAIAQYNLGDCYKYGWGVEVDEKEAVRWYQKAAAQDYP